jgi:hypothetical protein
VTAFLTCLGGFTVGLAVAMWIRWDQVQTLKEELDWARRRADSAEHIYDRNQRWRGIYNRRLDLDPERLP